MPCPAPDEWFTAEGSAAGARALHLSYQQRMREHFLAAVDSAAEGLGLDLGHVRRIVAELDPARRFSPGVYMILTELTSALGAGDVTRVIDGLHAIQVLPSGELYAETLRMDSCLTESWERPFVEHARHEPLDEGVERTKTLRPLLVADASHLFTPAFTALEHLKEVDPGLAAEFRQVVARVKLFSGKGFLGFSSPAAFGAIYLRLPDADPVEYFLEHLVHELSHLTLNALMAHDPLLRNPGDRHPSPLRDGERPLFQVLHATFALNRNVRVSRRLVEAGADLACSRELPGFEAGYAAGRSVLEAHAQLTEAGRALLASCEPLARA